MEERFIIFDIWGDYAHFKKYYTTSSPLTFSIPPRTALIGIISAIIGIGKEEYLSLMTKDKAKIAVRIINPIKKVRITQNLIDTKGGYWKPVRRGNLTGRTQIQFEFLKNPRFRIYFNHYNEEIYNSLKTKLIAHKSVYTPYLGISELIADFEYVVESGILKKLDGDKFCNIHTVIPLQDLIDFDKEDFLKEGKKYFKERIPVEMLSGRIVTEYLEVLYEIEGKTIRAKTKNTIELDNGDVIILL